MTWRIEFDAAAAKELKKLSHSVQKDIRDYLRKRIETAEDPRQFGKALHGDKIGLWRYRVGKYRIVCKLEDDVCIILVLRIAKRDKVYDRDL